MDTKEFNDSVGDGLRAGREQTFLCVAYDTMVRRSELVAFNVDDMKGYAQRLSDALDPAIDAEVEEGSMVYLSRTTVNWLGQ
jgi:hypothetical protein